MEVSLGEMLCLCPLYSMYKKLTLTNPGNHSLLRKCKIQNILSNGKFNNGFQKCL
jgi:hypothetical protein